MAKIVQVITRASEQYEAAVAHSLIRDLDMELILILLETIGIDSFFLENGLSSLIN